MNNLKIKWLRDIGLEAFQGENSESQIISFEKDDEIEVSFIGYDIIFVEGQPIYNTNKINIELKDGSRVYSLDVAYFTVLEEEFK